MLYCTVTTTVGKKYEAFCMQSTMKKKLLQLSLELKCHRHLCIASIVTLFCKPNYFKSFISTPGPLVFKITLLHLYI